MFIGYLFEFNFHFKNIFIYKSIFYFNLWFQQKSLETSSTRCRWLESGRFWVGNANFLNASQNKRTTQQQNLIH